MTGQVLPGPEQSQLPSTLQPQALPVPRPPAVLLSRAQSWQRLLSLAHSITPTAFPAFPPKAQHPTSTRKSPQEPQGWTIRSGELTEQWGHTKPLMFSTMPRIRNPAFLQNVSSRLTSPTDTA